MDQRTQLKSEASEHSIYQGSGQVPLPETERCSPLPEGALSLGGGTGMSWGWGQCGRNGRWWAGLGWKWEPGKLPHADAVLWDMGTYTSDRKCVLNDNGTCSD